MFPDDDFVLVTEGEFTDIVGRAIRTGRHIAWPIPVPRASDGRIKIPCTVWCDWVKEGYANEA